MKFLNLLKTFVAPSASERLAKLDVNLRADLGLGTTYANVAGIRTPSDLGLRLL